MPGTAPAGPDGELPEPPVFPTPTSKPLNGLSGSGNSFSGEQPGEGHPDCYVNVEYLYWWMKDYHLPPLVTTGSANAPIPGKLGGGNTHEVLGDNIDQKGFSGGRISAAWFLPNPQDLCTAEYLFGHEHALDINASFFGLEERRHLLGAASNQFGNPVLSRPFFNPNAHSPDADPIALPTFLAGSAAVSTLTRLWGGEANLRITDTGGGANGSHLGLFVGARYVSLDETLTIQTASHDLPPAPAGSAAITDEFGTLNRFYGGQVGAAANFWWWNKVDVNVTTKVAFGESDETLEVRGSSVVTNIAGLSPDRGLLAQPSNIGRHHRTTFAVLPELIVDAGVWINPNIRLALGYDLLYWSDVLAPGDQIDPVVSVQPVLARGQFNHFQAPLTGPARPAVNLSNTDFWVQGLTFGVEFSY
jgi:hypothetical protein